MVQKIFLRAKLYIRENQRDKNWFTGFQIQFSETNLIVYD